MIPTEYMESFEDNIWGTYLNTTGLSKFPKTTLSKMLAGKQVHVRPSLHDVSHGISGQSTPKDLETAFQLLYLYYTDPRFDNEEFETGIQQIKAILPNLASNPNFLFQNFVSEKLYGNNPRVATIDEKTVEAASLATIEKVYREILFNSTAGGVLTVVGNVELETLKPLVEKYIGSLPKGKTATEVNTENLLNFVKGEVNETLTIPMQTPKKTILQVFSAYLPVTTKDIITLNAANYVLDMIYTNTIREKEGGTYGVGSNLDADRAPYSSYSFLVQFDTNPEQAEKLAGLTVQYLKELAQNGPTAEELTMALENLKKNLPESRISNSYWKNALELNLQHGIDYDAEYEKALSEVTIEDIKTLMQAVLAQNNFIQLVLAPKE